MRIKFKLLYAVRNGKKTLLDESGAEVTVDSLLKSFGVTNTNPVSVLLAADDGRHDMIPFDMEKGKMVLTHKLKGCFSTADGRNVKVYSFAASGGYPVVGLGPGNEPMLWDAEGNPKDGPASMRLMLQLEHGDKPEEKAADAE